MPSLKVLLSLVLLLLLNGLIVWFTNRPMDIGMDLPDGKLMSLSFAPYRDGYSPITGKDPLPEHIDQDLGLISDKTLSIRTYSIQGGMGPTPDFARKHGVALIQGGWLGPSQAGNKKEMAVLINAANQHADVIKRVIVGNEVLLRNDMDVDTLIGYIRQVKQGVKQPVSYADAWGTYMRYPQLINEVDFITIHILPYWEDEPIAIEHATQHIEEIVAKIKALALSMGQDKPILIGESGWPAAGRQRGLAVPSIVNQAKYIRSMIDVANRHHFDYNIVEAFNQNWKNQHEGVVGANWGLMSIDRKPVFSFTGPVVENRLWLLEYGLACFLAVAMATLYFSRLPSLTTINLLVFLTLNQLFAFVLVKMGHELWFTSFDNRQKAYALFIILANSALLYLLLAHNYALLAGQSVSSRIAKLFKASYGLFYMLAIFKTYELAFHGRFLSFPVAEFLLPVSGLFGLLLCGWLHKQLFVFKTLDLNGVYGRWLARIMLLGMAALLFNETSAFLHARDFVMAHPQFWEALPIALLYTFNNGQLLEWTAVIILLSLPYCSLIRQISSQTHPRLLAE